MTDDRSGFTLMEMLVALSLFALIGAAGAAVLTTGATNREVVSGATERLSRLQRLGALLRADLGQALPRGVREADGRVRSSALVGGQGEVLVDFVRGGMGDGQAGRQSAIQRVDYRLVDGRLERRAWPHPDGARPGEPLVLHDAVRSARTWFIVDGRESETWVSTADTPLPDAVRLQLDLADWGEIELLVMVGRP